MSIDFSAAAPNPGETVTLRFNLPDGTSENLTLTATTDSPPGANEFTIGAHSRPDRHQFPDSAHHGSRQARRHRP